MALHPRQTAQRLHVPHRPLYLVRSRSAPSTGDRTQSSRRESVRTFPRGSGRRLQGTTVPSAMIVIPDTAAAHPLMATLPASAPSGLFIWAAIGSPVTIERRESSRDRSDE